ncbi:serine hydroxymethyltransferase [Bilophila wadsworthia]|uniref:serine hydroxymethyltransferase n=1 Tax=Bilophila wadsworthia TaxID=35833 RepID=UPI0025978CE8|nr:serine hydroxymethyltransferase [Bilophila wadsworthia]
MKHLFYLLTAAAHPFGLYVVVPLYMEHCYVVTGSDGAGRAMAASFAELFAIALWTLGVVIVSLLVSRLHYKEWLPTIGINTIIILIYLRLLLGL